MKSLVLAATVLLAHAPPLPAAQGMLGFGADAAARQSAVERSFDAALVPGNLDSWMARIAGHPHHLGSPHGRANAEWIAEQFRAWGYQTRIETYDVLFPTPLRRRLELLAPVRYVAELREPVVAGDEASTQAAERLPVYNAYSVDGNVEGELVYVNYGLPEDYEELDRRGVSVEGRLVIARYGGAWRGIKPKVAAEHGAIGCIVYSDPRDDGYFEGDVYPRGGYRNERSAQRGSVADMPTFPGDPLTPGRAATPEAERLSRDAAPTLTKIPVLPISYADARPLLEAIAGPVAPTSWRGALPITYHVGPGPARVRLQVAFDWKLTPAHDVIAVLPGVERPEQWVVRGNHHDAWVNGAADPVSGLVVLLEEARAIGELARHGMPPKRTIVFAAWDGEEPGLLGSTEWVEDHADELREKAVAYLNTDSNSRGFLDAGGSHTLERLVNEAARDVADPQIEGSVAERRLARDIVLGDDAARAVAREGRFRLDALGSGSDYTPFLQHLGIASLSVGFGGEGAYGQYHSTYDSVEHYRRFMDPGMGYGTALARLNGRIVLRLANAEVLPFDPSDFASTVGRYAEEVETLAGDLREQAAERRRRLDEGVYERVSDPGDPLAPPPAQAPVPFVNFAPLKNAVAALEASAAAYVEARDARISEGPPLGLEDARRLDAILMRLEPSLTRAEGLPGREWYVHDVYAPGFYTGYGVKTLPGVRENLEARRFEEAERQVSVAAEVLGAFRARIDAATEVWSGR